MSSLNGWGLDLVVLAPILWVMITLKDSDNSLYNYTEKFNINNEIKLYVSTISYRSKTVHFFHSVPRLSFTLRFPLDYKDESWNHSSRRRTSPDLFFLCLVLLLVGVPIKEQ